MSRDRVERRAHRIYEHLRDRLNEPQTLDDVLAAAGCRDGATTRAAIRRARSLAEDDGLCFPVACPANGFTYVVTDDPTLVVDSTVHLSAIEQGVGARKDVHDRFMMARREQLDPIERSIVINLNRFDEAARAQREAHRAVLQAVVTMRREARADDNNGAPASP